MSLAERLKYARNAGGLTLLQVEERTKLGKSSISEWENGTREPSLSQLVQLGRIYPRGTSFFLDEGQMPSDVVL